MKYLLLSSLLSTLTLTACSKVENAPYSEILVKNFTQSCTKTGGKAEYCQCVINELPKHLTEKKYIELETSYSMTGKIPDEMANALSKGVSACYTHQ